MNYKPFGMCPFSVASVGGGSHIMGVGSESYAWTHYRCLAENCKLWTNKKTSDGTIYQGCIFEFMGLSDDEISLNFDLKEAILSQDKRQLEKSMICPKCLKEYDASWKVCLACGISLKPKEVSKENLKEESPKVRRIY